MINTEMAMFLNSVINVLIYTEKLLNLNKIVNIYIARGRYVLEL